jgi:hypothetical protein
LNAISSAFERDSKAVSCAASGTPHASGLR